MRWIERTLFKWVWALTTAARRQRAGHRPRHWTIRKSFGIAMYVAPEANRNSIIYFNKPYSSWQNKTIFNSIYYARTIICNIFATMPVFNKPLSTLRNLYFSTATLYEEMALNILEKIWNPKVFICWHYSGTTICSEYKLYYNFCYYIKQLGT